MDGSPFFGLGCYHWPSDRALQTHGNVKSSCQSYVEKRAHLVSGIGGEDDGEEGEEEEEEEDAEDEGDCPRQVVSDCSARLD